MGIVRRILKEEKGVALPTALVLLVLGALLIVPVLRLTSTGLNANRVVENNTEEFYAADTGIEYALWHLNRNLEVRRVCRMSSSAMTWLEVGVALPV